MPFSQDPVWYKYKLKTYISAEFRKGFGKRQRMPERELSGLKDLRFENTVDYVRKGSLRFQKVSGPMTRGKLWDLTDRQKPSIFVFDGQKAISIASPKYVQVSSQRGMSLLYENGVASPSDINDEENVLTDLKSTAKGEIYDLTAFKDDELVDGERLCLIELQAKKSKWRNRIYLYPTHSYAVKSREVISPTIGTVWKVHDCTYREIEGVAYLESGTRTSYGGKREQPNVRFPIKEFNYKAQSIETDIRKFPDLQSEAKVDSDAVYNDVDLKTITTSPEQVQGVLDTIAGMSKISTPASVFPWRQWLYGLITGGTAVGFLAIAIALIRRWRRRPAA